MALMIGPALSSATRWHARLTLDYRLTLDGGTTAHDAHEGPLRVLQRLYPEGPKVCHHVLVHPPGGVAGGDELLVEARLAAGTHALVTTPGATRFYRSDGAPSLQSARLAVEDDARLEWLPLEAIAYEGCIAENRVVFELAPRAQMIGWDVLALGLPAAGSGFGRGRFQQHVEWPGHWLERGLLDGSDETLLHSPVGLAGHGVLATLWCASGSEWPSDLRESLLEDARLSSDASALAATAGSTSPQPGLVVMRVLAQRVEPAMTLLQAVRAAWRQRLWGLPAATPRVWRT
jgi:urease accessory protein